MFTQIKNEKEPLKNQYDESPRTTFNKEDFDDKITFVANDLPTEGIQLLSTNLSSRGTTLVCSSPLATRRKGGPISNIVHTILCAETMYDMN